MVGIVAPSSAGVPRDTSAAAAAEPAAWTMTAHTLHTPLEELLFFQSLRHLGNDAANFAKISATLQQNEFVRANPDFDADRLSPGSLQQLYLRLLKYEMRGAVSDDSSSPSRSGDVNRRKRKLSTPPLQSLDEAAEHSHLLPQLVDRLYAQYQEHVVRAIRAEEARYDGLTKDIAEIERGDWDQRLEKGELSNGVERSTRVEARTPGVKVEPELLVDDKARSQPNLLSSERPARSPGPSQATPLRHTSPAVTATPNSHLTASPNRPSDQARPANSTPRPLQGTPMPAPPLPHATTPQSNYPQQPFNFYAPQGHPPYGAVGPQGTLHGPYHTPTAGQLAQQQQAYRGVPAGGFPGAQPSFMVYQSQSSGFPTPQRPVAAATQTPISTGARRQTLPLINTNVSSTKWKSTGPVQRSPTAPPRSPFLPSSPDLSPSEDTKTPIPPNRRSEDGRDPGTPTRGSSRRGRWANHPARGRGSRTESQRNVKESTKTSRTRSQSVVSHAEESAAEPPQTRRLRGDPSTPHAITEDASAISTPASASRPGHHRRNTLRGSIDIGRSVLKRKRADTLEGSPEVPTLPKQPTRPNHILATRNFHRIVQPLMQEINSHKLASMFSKPITERDAPGYQSIIYQPQDLKSIRGAISTGSRVIQNADKEVAEAGADDAASPATPSNNMNAPKSTIWLEKSAEVIPPKAIVNSGQLEKEVYRMFANAVMFNLDPQRGLGAAEHRPKGADDDEEEDDDNEKHYEVDDGGAFVRDAREMFTSVEESVSRWRSVEGGGTGSRPRGVDESEAEEPATEG